MVSARRQMVVLIYGIALLVMPTGAIAKPGYFITDPLRSAQIHLEGSHGYNLRITAFDTNVNVDAKKAEAQVSYSSYSGSLRGDRVWARLPGVGWINLRFEESSRYRRDPSDNCKGPGELVRLGIFKGRLRLRGERDYTRVDVRAVEGKIQSDPREVCRSQNQARASAGAPGEKMVQAATMRGSGVLSFEATEWPPFAGSRPVFFFANLWRQRGQLMIRNTLGGFTEDPRGLIVAKPPLSASVAPPRPLVGTATFQRESSGEFSWLGDLEADLPGIGPVALAGPGFAARVCDGPACKGSISAFEPPLFRATAAAPTPSPWRWPGFPR